MTDRDVNTKREGLPVLEGNWLRGVGTVCEPSDLRAGGGSQDRCHSSLGERALGCGRWSSALTEPFRLYVRSLTRAPLARSVKRGGLPSKTKAPVVQVQRAHRSIAFGPRGEC